MPACQSALHFSLRRWCDHKHRLNQASGSSAPRDQRSTLAQFPKVEFVQEVERADHIVTSGVASSADTGGARNSRSILAESRAVAVAGLWSFADHEDAAAELIAVSQQQQHAASLRRITNDKSEGRETRILALALRGVTVAAGQMKRAVPIWHKVIQLAETVPLHECNAIIYTGIDDSGTLIRGAASEQIDMLVAAANDILHDGLLKCAAVCRQAVQQAMPVDANASTLFSRLIPQTFRHSFEQLTKQQEDELLLDVYSTYVLERECAGICCDTCSLCRALRKCTKCGVTAYCSRECQRKHWNAYHRKVCRPPGVLRPGDVVQVSEAALAAAGVADEQVHLCILKEQVDAESWLAILNPIVPQADLREYPSLVSDCPRVIATSELALNPAMLRHSRADWVLDRFTQGAD